MTKIAKVVSEPQTDATKNGNDVHRALEKAVKGDEGLGHKYAQYQPLVTRIRSASGEKQTEYKFGLTSSFKPTTFFANDVWVRGVIDLAILRSKSAIVLDYKTGKPKTDDDQLSLFAAVSFARFPNIEEVHTGYAWLGHNKLVTSVYKREESPLIWQGFVGRVKRMEHAAMSGDFPPKPSGLCREWCPVGKKNCEFCGKD